METLRRLGWRRAERPPACSFLGLASDGYRQMAEPSDEHRCYRTSPGQPIDLAHQQAYCLSGACYGCAIYLQRSTGLHLPASPRPDDPTERLLGQAAAIVQSPPPDRQPRLRLLVKLGLSLVVVTLMIVALLTVVPLGQPLLLYR